MPELPEVETIAGQLNEVLQGRVIEEIKVLREKSFIGDPKRISARAIKRVTRKAKMIVVELETLKRSSAQALNLVIHLKMTGQLIFVDGKERVFGGHPTADWINSLPSKHTRVIVTFKDKSKLFFNDMRVFGWIKIMANAKFKMLNAKLPPDVVDAEFTEDYLEKVVRSSSRPVKLVLLDQSKVGGLGNIYINDALYAAHTKPTRKANSLTKQEITAIRKASIQVVRRGIEMGGTSQSTYKHINGMGGKYQEEFLIYTRVGQVCGLDGCKGVIEKIKLGGRGTYFCPVCQK